MWILKRKVYFSVPMNSNHKSLKIHIYFFHDQLIFLVYLEIHSALGRFYLRTEQDFPSQYYVCMNILNQCKVSLSSFHETFVYSVHYGGKNTKFKCSVLRAKFFASPSSISLYHLHTCLQFAKYDFRKKISQGHTGKPITVIFVFLCGIICLQKSSGNFHISCYFMDLEH